MENKVGRVQHKAKEDWTSPETVELVSHRRELLRLGLIGEAVELGK